MIATWSQSESTLECPLSVRLVIQSPNVDLASRGGLDGLAEELSRSYLA